MLKKVFFLLTLSVFFLLNTGQTLALGPGSVCTPGKDTCDSVGSDSYSCQFAQQLASGQTIYQCQVASVDKIFGKIQPPDALVPFLKNDPTGAGGISKFLSNLVALIYTMGSIGVIFMLVWGSFDWITSGGNKEQLEKARSRIINAIIGIIIMAAVFAILSVLGTFTGFQFFKPACPPSYSYSEVLKSCQLNGS